MERKSRCAPELGIDLCIPPAYSECSQNHDLKIFLKMLQFCKESRARPSPAPYGMDFEKGPARWAICVGWSYVLVGSNPLCAAAPSCSLYWLIGFREKSVACISSTFGRILLIDNLSIELICVS